MDIKVTKENILQALKENTEKAKDYLNDDEKMEKLFQNFEKKLKLIPGVGDRLSDIAVLLSMVRAYAKKQYTDVPLDTILIVVAAIIYAVNPLDIIPDALPGVGYVDDAAALAIVLQVIHTDIDDYKKWQILNDKR